MSLMPAPLMSTPPSRFFSNDENNVLPFAPLRHPTRVLGGLAAEHPGTTDRRGMSATTHSIGNGVKTFLFSPSINNADVWEVGGRVLARETDNPERWMEGTISAITSTSITLYITQTMGMGTLSSWELAFVDPLAGWPNGWRAGDRYITETDYVTDQAMVAFVRNGSTVFGAASNTETGQTIGYHSEVVASHPNGQPAWGKYTAAYRAVPGAGSITGHEINVAQLAGPSPSNDGISIFGRKGRTPYKAPVLGQSVGLGMGGGADRKVVGYSWANDAAHHIGNNGAAFWAGLVFAHDALMREGHPDDKTAPSGTGYARAVSLAYDHGISGYSLNPSGAAGTQEEVFRLRFSIVDPNIKMEMVFDDTGAVIQETVAPARTLWRVDRVDNPDAWPVMMPMVGTTAGVGVRGVGPNNNFGIFPSGTGTVYIPLANVPNYADDAAAQAAGRAIGTIYRTGSILKVRAA
jgi:hypothetical protein